MNKLKTFFTVLVLSATVFITIVLCVPSHSKYYDWAVNPSKLDKFLNINFPEHQSVDTLMFLADEKCAVCQYEISFRDTIPQNVIINSYGVRYWHKTTYNDNAYTYRYVNNETCPHYFIDAIIYLDEHKARIDISVDEDEFDTPSIFIWSIIFFVLIWIPLMLIWFGFIIISKIRDKIKAR